MQKEVKREFVFCKDSRITQRKATEEHITIFRIIGRVESVANERCEYVCMPPGSVCVLLACRCSLSHINVRVCVFVSRERRKVNGLFYYVNDVFESNFVLRLMFVM